jgi:hypothetical protein
MDGVKKEEGCSTKSFAFKVTFLGDGRLKSGAIL